jgi:hypothetical protein
LLVAASPHLIELKWDPAIGQVVGGQLFSTVALAMASGLPFAATARTDLTVADLDTRDIPGLDIGEIEWALRQHDYAFLIVSSGSAGSWHLWGVPASPEQRDVFENWLVQRCISRRDGRPDRQVMRSGRSIRLPLTPSAKPATHPGQITVATEDFWPRVQGLGPAPDRVRPAMAPTNARLLAGLPEKLRSELINGRPSWQPKGGRRVWEQAMVWRLLSEGLTETEVVALAFDPALTFGHKAREVERQRSGNGCRYLQARFNAAHSLGLGRPSFRGSSEVRAELRELQHGVQVASLATYPSDAAWLVLQAVLSLAADVGKVTLAASERDLANIAGITRPTVSKGLSHLCSGEQAPLRVVRLATRSEATTYRIELRRVDASTRRSDVISLPHAYSAHPKALYVWPKNDGHPQLGHEVFGHGCLNTAGFHVASILARHGPLTDVALIEMTGRSSTAVRRALHRLQKVGAVKAESSRQFVLVVKNEQGWDAIARRHWPDAAKGQAARRRRWDYERKLRALHPMVGMLVTVNPARVARRSQPLDKSDVLGLLRPLKSNQVVVDETGEVLSLQHAWEPGRRASSSATISALYDSSSRRSGSPR